MGRGRGKVRGDAVRDATTARDARPLGIGTGRLEARFSRDARRGTAASWDRERRAAKGASATRMES